VPNDPLHQIKIIDFGSSCDWGDPMKRGLGGVCVCACVCVCVCKPLAPVATEATP